MTQPTDTAAARAIAAQANPYAAPHDARSHLPSPSRTPAPGTNGATGHSTQRRAGGADYQLTGAGQGITGTMPYVDRTRASCGGAD
jgi:hypothetical protein